MDFILYSLFLSAILLLLWQSSNLISVFWGSPWVATRKKIIKKVIEEIDLKKGQNFIELGCGDGKVLLEASRTGANIFGYEISPWYFFLAKIKTFGRKNIKVEFKNIWHSDLRKADVVYCYLLPNFLKKLTPKFKKELQFSARLVSIGFQIEDLRLVKKIGLPPQQIFIYQKN